MSEDAVKKGGFDDAVEKRLTHKKRRGKNFDAFSPRGAMRESQTQRETRLMGEQPASPANPLALVQLGTRASQLAESTC